MADEAKRDRYIGGDVFPRSGHSPEAAVVSCLAPRHPRSRSDPRLVCRSPSRRLRHGAARPIRGIARMPGRGAVRLDQRPGSAIARVRPRRNPIAARLPLYPAPDVTLSCTPAQMTALTTRLGPPPALGGGGVGGGGGDSRAPAETHLTLPSLRD